MILGHLQQPSHAGLPAVLVRAIALAQAHDLHTIAPGRYELQGDNVLMNVMAVSYRCAGREKAELHSQFIDIQILLAGKSGSFMASPGRPVSAKKRILTRIISFVVGYAGNRY
jgi:YhcH/YjgK/YiaL family protein